MAPGPGLPRWIALAAVLAWPASAQTPRGEVQGAGAIFAAQGKSPMGQTSDLEMVRIPPGTFTMGSPDSEPGRALEEEPHQVSVSGFLLGKYPVTQAQWTAVTGVNPSLFRGSGRLPAEDLTWYACIEFCNLKSLAEGRTPCYRFGDSGADPRQWPRDWKRYTHDHIACDWSAEGYRLPTEAEWEYACRAGTTLATPFGAALSSTQANFNGEHPYNHAPKGPNLQRTTEVGSYPPNPWGLYDMPGNISQWCWDWYAPYPKESRADPHGPLAGQGRRVFRGGCWFSYGEDLRSAARFGDVPCFRLDMTPGGLRVARSVAP